MLNRTIDWLQATFPPNRIAILLAGVITAVSGSIAAWLAAHAPGLNFGQAEIAGVLGAAVIITIRLLDRWFDRWQEGERVDYQADLETALDELAEDPAAQRVLENLGTVEQAAHAVADLRASVEAGTLQPEAIALGLGTLGDTLARFLHEVAQHPADHGFELAPAPEPAAPAPAA